MSNYQSNKDGHFYASIIYRLKLTVESKYTIPSAY